MSSNTLACPPEELLVQFAEGRLHHTLAVENHLDRCHACRVTTDDLFGQSSDDSDRSEPSDPWAELRCITADATYRPGDTIGRYIVRDVVGQGAMGVVYSGFDPELDREVALKVLRSGSNGRPRAPIMAEARLLARLRHPNIVDVYDVVGDYCLAMQPVWGDQLDGWLTGSQRSLANVLEVFTGAAEALAAAHEIGLVHRDFKPANVLVDAAGRPHVTDFGLAALLESGEAEVRPSERIGTPAYMAPEVGAGRAADERSDQFSFFVCLYEALHGHRPWSISGRQTMISPRIRADLPSELRQLQRRGLAVEPCERLPSMRGVVESLNAISDRVRRRRLRWWGAGAIAVSMLMIALVLFQDRPPPPCPAGAPASLAAALTTLNHRSGPVSDAYGRARTEILDRTTALEAIRGERCHSTPAARTLAFDHSMMCVRRHWQRLDAAAQVIAENQELDAETIESIVAGIPPSDECRTSDETFARPGSAVDPLLASDFERVTGRLARVWVLVDASQLADSHALLEEVAADVQRIDYPRLTAEWEYLMGRTTSGLNHYEQARRHYQRAYALARGHRDDRIAAMAANDLVALECLFLGDLNASEQWAAQARALSSATGDDVIIASSLRGTAVLRREQGQVSAATALMEEAVETYSRATGPTSRFTLMAKLEAAALLLDQGNPELAEAWAHDAWLGLLQWRGVDDPTTLLGRAIIARSQIEQGDYLRANVLFAEIRTPLQEQLGADHPNVAAIVLDHARTYAFLGDLETATAMAGDARARSGRSLPAGHPWLAAMDADIAELPTLVPTPQSDRPPLAEPAHRGAKKRKKVRSTGRITTKG